MGTCVWADNATGTLASAVSAGASTIDVNTVTGSFPDIASYEYFRIAIDPGSIKYETAKVTLNSSGVLTLASPLAFGHALGAAVGIVVATADLASLFQLVNILDFDVDPTGSNDSGIGINQAIAELCSVGGPAQLYLPFGNFVCDEQLLFSVDNTGLVGAAPCGPGQGSGTALGTNIMATQIFGSDTLDKPLILFQGASGQQLINCVLRNVRVIGQNPTSAPLSTTNPSAVTGNVGVQRFACASGGVYDCSIAGFTQCLNSDLDPHDTATSSNWGTYERVRCDTGDFSTGTQWAFGSAAAVDNLTEQNDCFFERYTDCTAALSGTNASQYGFHIGYCDSNLYDRPSIVGPTGAVCFAFNYSLNPALNARIPAGCQISFPNLHSPTLTPAINIGVVGANAKPHKLFNPVFVNGVPTVLTQLDNLLAPWSEPTTGTAWNSLAGLQSWTFANGTASTNPNLYPCMVMVSAKDTATTVVVEGSGSMPVANGNTCGFRVAYGGKITLAWSTTAPATHVFYAGSTG